MSGNGITDEEKVRIRHHMGYLNASEMSSFVLGTPAGVETQFLIESAMNRVLVAAVPLLRQLIAELDCTEAQLADARKRMKASAIGNIQINPEETKQLRNHYEEWRGKLANLLGVPVNPFDKLNAGGAGLNVPVMH